MKPFVSPAKKSRKARHDENAKQRGSWNGVNPVTKVIPSRKLYDRKRSKDALRCD